MENLHRPTLATRCSAESVLFGAIASLAASPSCGAIEGYTILSTGDYLDNERGCCLPHSTSFKFVPTFY